MQSNEDIGPSFTKYMLENRYFYSLTETEMAFLADAFFVPGPQAGSMATCTELDAVIGRHRGSLIPYRSTMVQ
ncbi:hypothetical protein EDB19DRAFT_1688559 [Suillus lakei]|nr:hypothetical protein EDB19DRAFT_1688559 [Suillus lakei]